MKRLLPWITVALAFIGPVARGQTAAEGGCEHATVPLQVTSVSTSANVTQSQGRSTFYANQFLVNASVPKLHTTSVQEGLRLNLTENGPGTLTGGGHAVGMQIENYTSLSSQALAVAIEGVLANTGTGTLSNAYGYLAKVASNKGTIGTLSLLYPLVSNSGNISNYIEVHCNAPENTGIISNKYCIYNSDPEQKIQTAGQIIAARGELAPPAAAPQAPRRYYWGVNHGAASGRVTGLNTNTYWAPLYVAGATADGHVGFHVVAGVSGATCQIAIYQTYYGAAPGSPVFTSAKLSAASAGDVEESVPAPYIALSAGLYQEGINCTSNAVVIAGYVENAAYSIYGSSSSQGNDTTPITRGALFTRNPVVDFISAADEMPQMWVRR